MTVAGGSSTSPAYVIVAPAPNVFVTSVNDAASSATILAARPTRSGAVMHNNSTEVLYIVYGATASIAAGGYSYKIPADGTWEMPSGAWYPGVIAGIWAANGSGYVEVTELY